MNQENQDHQDPLVHLETMDDQVPPETTVSLERKDLQENPEAQDQLDPQELLDLR